MCTKHHGQNLTTLPSHQHIQAEGDFIQYVQCPYICTVHAHMKLDVESSTCDMMLTPKISFVGTFGGPDYEC